MSNNNRQSGFTVVELLIVIVVLGIVAALVYNSVRNAQAHAEATRTVNTLKAVEKSLYLKAIDEGVTEWWHENVYEACAGIASTSPNPPITGMITNCGLDTYLQDSSSESPYANLVYDADGNEFSGCGASTSTGVNLRIDVAVDSDEFEILDSIIDSGDGPTCGEVRQDLQQKVHYLMGQNLNAYAGG